MSALTALLVELEATGREYLIASLDHSQRIDDATQDTDRAKHYDELENPAIQAAWHNAMMRLGAAQVAFTGCLNRARAALGSDAK